MKIAHVNYLPNYFPGVENKLLSQAKASFIQNYKIDFFILNPNINISKRNVHYK